MNQWASDSVKKLKVIDLIPNDRNPKIHPDTQIIQLANSIREWGWTMPILIDEENGVIAGHGRLFAAKELGLEEVPCMVAIGWTAEQKRAYIIADNKLAENSKWDTGMYFSELKEMSNQGYDLTKMGVDIDLSVFNYQPSASPTFDASEIDESKMISAAQKMQDDQFNRINTQQGTDVVCPECGEEFTFTGS